MHRCVSVHCKLAPVYIIFELINVASLSTALFIKLLILYRDFMFDPQLASSRQTTINETVKRVHSPSAG